MENNTFTYQYSAKRNREIEDIRKKYLPQTESKLDRLRDLDKRVKRAPTVFAYIFGSIAALIMGAGMSLIMTDLPSLLSLGDVTLPALVTGVIGMLLALINYPIYQALLKSRKKKFAPEILRISEGLLNE